MYNLLKIKFLREFNSLIFCSATDRPDPNGHDPIPRRRIRTETTIPEGTLFQLAGRTPNPVARFRDAPAQMQVDLVFQPTQPPAGPASPGREVLVETVLDHRRRLLY